MVSWLRNGGFVPLAVQMGLAGAAPSTRASCILYCGLIMAVVRSFTDNVLLHASITQACMSLPAFKFQRASRAALFHALYWNKREQAVMAVLMAYTGVNGHVCIVCWCTGSLLSNFEGDVLSTHSC